MADKSQYSVLLVDDEPGVMKVLRLFLERSGYRVFEALNAEEAFEAIGRGVISLAILDAKLGAQSGFDICRKLKGDVATKDIIVFMFTGLGGDEEIREGELAGCDRYLTKPQNPVDIVALVDEYLMG